MLPTAATSLSAAQLAHVLEKYTYFLMTGTRVGKVIRTWPTGFVCELLKAMSAQKKQVFFLCVFAFRISLRTSERKYCMFALTQARKSARCMFSVLARAPRMLCSR